MFYRALAAGTGHDSWIPVNGNDPDVQTRHGNGASSGPTAGFPNIGGFSSLRTDDDEETGTKKDTVRARVRKYLIESIASHIL